MFINHTRVIFKKERAIILENDKASGKQHIRITVWELGLHRSKQQIHCESQTQVIT